MPSPKTFNPVVEGAIIWNTLHPADRIEAYAKELERLMPFNSVKLRSEADELLSVEGEDRDPAWHDAATDLMVRMTEQLEALAPEGMYFGSAEGNDSEIGFWRIEDPDDDLNAEPEDGSNPAP